MHNHGKKTLWESKHDDAQVDISVLVQELNGQWSRQGKFEELYRIDFDIDWDGWSVDPQWPQLMVTAVASTGPTEDGNGGRGRNGHASREYVPARRWRSEGREVG